MALIKASKNIKLIIAVALVVGALVFIPGIGPDDIVAWITAAGLVSGLI